MNIIIKLVLMTCACFAWSASAEVTNMKTITIHTLSGAEANYSEDHARLGMIMLDRNILFTVERPFVANAAAPDGIGAGTPYISSVPLGEYDLLLRESPKKGEQWHFVNTELGVYLEEADMKTEHDRFSCMFHIANRPHEVQGCIAPGFNLHDFGADGGMGVAQSASSLAVLKRYLSGETRAKLRII